MRTFEQAKAYAISQHHQPSRDWYRWCQVFSRQCVGAPGFGASARLAFNSIPPRSKHVTMPPPPGSIAYYGSGTSGSGHAVFAVEGGFVWSTDILRRGKIDRVRWDVFQTKWNLRYRGWIEACPSGALPVTLRASTRPGYKQNRKVYRSKMHLYQADSDSVWNLQLALMARGYSIGAGPTGTFGIHTMVACAAFQGSRGWKARRADGIPGAETIRQLGLVWVDR
ncbi:peptidoglycan-binding domain-containing protein [Nocardioides plantarum]|uniref:Peptidoglycan-binding domain-containing protein n=1 Tax=Nocardioides plantarum TaxID=29299 RepID=A0ABV5KEW2_9ACTN|nr:peptidoglycan-binding domain-containing protein [Nocardioides plantarum]